MNIKERVESVKKDLLDYYDLSDEDVKTKLEDISAIEAELDRLWRIEECAKLCQDIYPSPGNAHCHEKLREALEAAKGQE